MQSSKVLNITISTLGIYLIFSALLFPFPAPSFFSNLITGLLLITLSLIAIPFPSPLYFFPTLTLGLYLQLAPLLFWYPTWPPFLHDTLTGALLSYLSFQFLPIPPASKHLLPPRARYNPSSFSYRIPAAILALTCWLLAIYLAIFELGYMNTIWDPIFGDGTMKVLSSSISKSFPVPDAGLGAISYLLEALLALHGGKDRWKTIPWVVLSFGIFALPVGIISIILIILQPLAVHAWCSFCLLIALINALVAILSANEIIATLRLLKQERRKGHSLLRTLIHGVKGTP